MKKDRLNVYFDPALSAELDTLAARRKVSKSQIVEAALASYLSPDAADQREAAITRRLDRLTRAGLLRRIHLPFDEVRERHFPGAT